MSDDFDPSLLPFLVCPVTRGPLSWHEEVGQLRSESAGLAFPIVDAVPVLLVEAGEAFPSTA